MLLAERPTIIVPPAVIAARVALLPPERLREMASEYDRRCRVGGPWDHCKIAFRVCVEGAEVDSLRLQARDRTLPLADLRQQLMAFSRVVSERTADVNSWSALGRTFKRTHAAVYGATLKYRAVIEEALA